MQTEGWHDLGAIADRCGQPINEPTCKANKDSTPTRRDIVMANSEGLDCVSAFRVGWDDNFCTHAKLTLVLTGGKADDSHEASMPAADLHRLFNEKVDELTKALETEKKSRSTRASSKTSMIAWTSS